MQIRTWEEKKPFGAVVGQIDHCEMIEQMVHKENCCFPPEKARPLLFRPYKLPSSWLFEHLYPPDNLYMYKCKNKFINSNRLFIIYK